MTATVLFAPHFKSGGIMRYNKIAMLLVGSLLASASWAQGGPPAQAPMGFGPGNSPGWSLMTPQERTEHRNKMMGFTNYEDCAAYLAEHHAKMLERARKKGVNLPAEPRQGYCQRLPHKAGSS
jgi:hypothetical protein